MAAVIPTSEEAAGGEVLAPPPELMDHPELAVTEASRALADLRRVNRWLFGYRPVLRTLLPRLERRPGATWLLDIGTGSGDVAAQVVRAARRRGREVRVVGLDAQLRHLVVGRRWYPEQLRVVASADALPFADAAVDWSLSTLFFHHFGGAANRRILAEMRRVARRGAAVIDLCRSPLLTRTVGLLLRLLRVGPVAFHDGKVSAAHAWSCDEVRTLVGDESAAQLRRRFPFRFSLVLACTSPSAPPDRA